MRLLFWIGFIVGPWVPWAGAAPTAPGDAYFVGVKDGYGPLTVKELCFAGDSAYFVHLKDSSKSFLPLSEISAIEKDTRKGYWIGTGIGLATYIAGSVALYYIGGGNAPGVMWDRKESFILVGLLFAPATAAFGGMIGDIVQSETLFNSRDVGKYHARRLELGCRDSAVAGNSNAIKSHHNLKTDLDRKCEADGRVLRGFPGKNRLDLTTGLGIPQLAETPVENWRLAGTRILKVIDGTTGTVNLAFSQAKRLDTTGHTYEVDVAIGAERRWVSRLFGYVQTGIGIRYPVTDALSDEPDAFGLDLFLSLGLLANVEQAFFLGEISHYSMASTLRMRLGAGWWF